MNDYYNNMARTFGYLEVEAEDNKILIKNLNEMYLKNEKLFIAYTTSYFGRFNFETLLHEKTQFRYYKHLEYVNSPLKLTQMYLNIIQKEKFKLVELILILISRKEK